MPRTRVIRNVRPHRSAQTHWSAFCVLAAAGLLVFTGSAIGEIGEEARSVSVRVFGRELVAVDSEARGSHPLPLEVGERVLSYDASGRIGIAVTDRRLVGFSSAGGWSERRLRIAEATPSRAELGPRVALFLTSQRAIGFDGHWREAIFSAQEEALGSNVGTSSVVVVTNLRALALTPASSGFQTIAMRASERVENLYARSASAEVHTSERRLVFQGGWREERRTIE